MQIRAVGFLEKNQFSNGEWWHTSFDAGPLLGTAFLIDFPAEDFLH